MNLLFPSALLIAFMYAIAILSYEHAQNRHNRGEYRESGYDK